MDNLYNGTNPVDAPDLRYGPARPAAPALALVAAILIVAGLASDTAGRVGAGVAAAVLLLAAIWVCAGPVVRADTGGVVVRRLFGDVRLPWSEVIGLRADDRRRSRSLEIETAERLVLIPAPLLGRTTVTHAVGELTELREAAGTATAVVERRPSAG